MYRRRSTSGLFYSASLAGSRSTRRRRSSPSSMSGRWREYAWGGGDDGMYRDGGLRSGCASCRVDDKLSYKLNTSGMKMHYPSVSFVGARWMPLNWREIQFRPENWEEANEQNEFRDFFARGRNSKRYSSVSFVVTLFFQIFFGRSPMFSLLFIYNTIASIKVQYRFIKKTRGKHKNRESL